VVFKSIKGIVYTFLALATFNINAAIVSVDWQAAGDNLITLDTLNGLEWLDLTATVNRSYNDISSKFGSGEEFEGWRYATRVEVSDFFDEFGGNNAFYDQGWSEENNGLFDKVSLYWGDLYCAAKACDQGEGQSWFLTAEALSDTHQSWGRIGDLYTDGSNPERDYVLLNIGGGRPLGATSSFAGSALVRVSAVPLPAAVWLFGSGLIGLIGIARRKRA